MSLGYTTVNTDNIAIGVNTFNNNVTFGHGIPVQFPIDNPSITIGENVRIHFGSTSTLINTVPIKKYCACIYISGDSEDEVNTKSKIISECAEKLPEIMEELAFLKNEIKRMKMGPVCQSIRLIPGLGVDYFAGMERTEEFAKNEKIE